MRDIQGKEISVYAEALLELSKINNNFIGMTLREIGGLFKEPMHPQRVQHYLQILRKNKLFDYKKETRTWQDLIKQ
jgi:hypothetical protein